MQGYLQSKIPYDTTNQNTEGVAGGMAHPSQPYDPNHSNVYNMQQMTTGAWFVPPKVDYNSPAHLAAVAAVMGNYAEAAVRGHEKPIAQATSQNNFMDQVALTASRGSVRKAQGRGNYGTGS